MRVQWMRADEHGWDPKGPPMLVDLRAGFDDQGNVIAWESEFFVPGLDPRPGAARRLRRMPVCVLLRNTELAARFHYWPATRRFPTVSRTSRP